MDLEIFIQPLIEKIERSFLSQSQKEEGVKLLNVVLNVVLNNAKQKPRMYELEKLLPPLFKVEDIIDTFTARNNSVPFKPFILWNSPVIFPKQLHKQYKCLRDLNEYLSSSGGTEVQSKTPSKADNHGALEKKSSSNLARLKKSLSMSKDAVVPPKNSITTTRIPPTISEGNQVFTSGNKDVGKDSSVLKDAGQHQSWVKTSCHREEGSVLVVLEHLVSKLAQPVLDVRTRQVPILKTNMTSPAIAIFLWSAYNSYHTKEHFQFRSWVHVSRESQQGNILSDILKQVTTVRQEQGLSDQLLRKRLHDFLIFKRYLIVLYGVLSDEVWHNLKSAFPYSLNGSRVILLLSGGTTLNNVSKDRSHQQLRKFSDYLQEESGTLGVADIMNELSQSILNPYRMLFLISIVGVVEKEKTTLLWAMYNAEDVKQLFQCRAWVHVSEKFKERGVHVTEGFKERDLLAEILKQVTDNEQEEELDPEPLRLKLCNFLAQKRYLIVLYDVWSANVWDKLKLSLPNSMNGSRVILTVHEADVAQKTNAWIFGTVCGKELLHEKVCNPKVKHSWGRLSDIVAKESGIVGLDDKLKELAEVVLNSHPLHFLISVVGVAGSGKTALVKAFYNSLAVKQHFDCRAFVSVSQVFEIRKLLADLSMQLGMVRKDESWSKEELQKRLGLFLAWKRYLIVFDDVYTADVWEKLKCAFPNSSNGSRVILTTRDACVPRNIEAHTRVIQLRSLNDDESWNLFVEKVPKVSQNAELIKAVKEKILQRCGGRPLDIVVLGGLLSTKEPSIQAWSKFIEQVSQKKEKKGRVAGEDGDVNSSVQPPSSYMKPENGKKFVTDQSYSSTQHDSADTKLAEKDDKGEIEEIGPSEAPPIKGEKVKDGATKEDREDQEPSPNQLPSSSDTTQKEDNMMTQNTSFGKDQSGSSDEEALSGILALGYKDLNAHLKFCLNYLGLFPKSYGVPVRRFFQLLQAEGLSKQGTNKESFEEQVKEYIEDLKERNMIEVEKQKSDGSPKTIRMQSTIYDSLSPRAVRAGLFHHDFNNDKKDASKQFEYIRRLAEHQEISYDRLPEQGCQLRSYFSFKTDEGDLPAFGVDKLLKEIVKGGLGLIVILDLEGVYKPVLSKHLGKLPNLKYLGLRWTFLDSIPNSVGDLPSLETLDVKHTNINTLPGEFWKAKCLQHLYLNNMCVDTSTPKARQTNGSLTTSTRKARQTNGPLTNLKTLLGLVIRNKNSVDYLKAANSNGLRKLGLTCSQELITGIFGWISKLTKLQSLKLRSINKSREPSSLKLENLSDNAELSQLYLIGKLEEKLEVSNFPSKLEILILAVSKRSEDPMEELGKLKSLKILRLHARSYTGKTMTCHPGTFPNLQVLKLWMLEELETWEVEKGAMPALEEVEIRCCKKLNNIDGLKELTKLKDLLLRNMKQDFVKQLKESLGMIVREDSLKFSSTWEKNAQEMESTE